MSSVTVMPLQNDPIYYCYFELIPKSLEIADEIIPTIIGKFHEKNDALFKGFF